MADCVVGLYERLNFFEQTKVRTRKKGRPWGKENCANAPPEKIFLTI